MNKLGGEFRADAQIGRQNLLAGEFYQPLTPNAYFFVAPNAALQSYPINLFSEGVRVAQYNVTSATAGLDLGGQFTKYGELRLGAWPANSSSTWTRAAWTPAHRHRPTGAFVAKVYVDQIDSVRFPRSGYVGTGRVFASQTMLGADDQYTKWDVDAAAAASVGRHTLAAGVRLAGRSGTRRFRSTTSSSGAASCRCRATAPARS